MSKLSDMIFPDLWADWKGNQVVPRDPNGDYLPARDFVIKRSVKEGARGEGNWQYIGRKVPMQVRARKVPIVDKVYS